MFAARHLPAEELPELRAVLELACGKAELLHHAERPWSSATFQGVRHTIALRFVGGEAVSFADAFIAALPCADFALAGKVVADAAIVWVDRTAGPCLPETTLAVELLVLEKC